MLRDAHFRILAFVCRPCSVLWLAVLGPPEPGCWNWGYSARRDPADLQKCMNWGQRGPAGNIRPTAAPSPDSRLRCHGRAQHLREVRGRRPGRHRLWRKAERLAVCSCCCLMGNVQEPRPLGRQEGFGSGSHLESGCWGHRRLPLDGTLPPASRLLLEGGPWHSGLFFPAHPLNLACAL